MIAASEKDEQSSQSGIMTGQSLQRFNNNSFKSKICGRKLRLTPITKQVGSGSKDQKQRNTKKMTDKETSTRYQQTLSLHGFERNS